MHFDKIHDVVKKICKRSNDRHSSKNFCQTELWKPIHNIAFLLHLIIDCALNSISWKILSKKHELRTPKCLETRNDCFLALALGKW